MDYKKYLDEMAIVVRESHDDEEVGHIDADRLLCSFIQELGYPELVEVYNNVFKWYA